VLSIGLLTAAAGRGQDPVGGIRGSVQDAEFDGPVPFAIVRLSELDLQQETAEDGYFLFESVPAGTYTLIISKVDYERHVESSVVVVPGELAEVSVRLKGEFVEMEEFVARDLALDDTRSEIGLLSMRETSLSFQDSISADLMKQAGASDAAGALRLVVGASVVGGRFATVRGLSDRYVGTVVNGLRVPSSDPRKRAVHMDIFPAGTIESISVSKTFTPELYGDWTGGGVNIRTLSLPDKPFIKFSITREHDTQSTGKDNMVTYKGHGVGTWGRDMGSRDMPEGAADMEETGLTERGLVSNHVRPAGPEFPHSPEYLAYDEITRAFAPAMGTTTRRAYPNSGLGLSAGGKIDMGGGLAAGATGAFTWSRKDKIRPTFETDYVVPPESNPDDGVEEDYLRNTGQEELKWSLLVSGGIAKDEDHDITLTAMRNRVTTDTATIREQKHDPETSALWSQEQAIHYAERNIDVLQLIGEHQWENAFGETMGLDLKWYGAYNTARQYEPDVRSFDNVVVRREDGAYWEWQQRPDNVSGADEDSSTRIWRDTQDKNAIYGFGVGLPFEVITPDLHSMFSGPDGMEWTKKEALIRFGTDIDQTRRRYEQTSFFYTFANQTPPAPTDFNRPLRTDFPGGRNGRREWLEAVAAWEEGPAGAAYNQAVADTKLDASIMSYTNTAPDGLWTDVFTDPDSVGVSDYQNSMLWYLLPKFRDISYDGTQDLTGGFLSLELPLTKQFTFAFGARAEGTDILIVPESDLEELDPEKAFLVPVPNLSTNDDGEVSVTWAIEPVTKEEATADIDEADWLRSVNLTYEIIPGMNLRGSWSQTIARPTFLELAPVVTFDFIEDETFVGNSDLMISHIQNYDARWEWFRRPGEVFAISYFYKKIRDPIETISFGYLNRDYLLAVNYPEGEIRGMEFELRKDLDFLPRPFKAFSFGGNYTFIDAKVEIPELQRNSLDFHGLEQNKRDMEGQPEELLNLNLTWNKEDWGTTAGVFYNARGDMLRAGAAVGDGGATPNIYDKSREWLNISLTQKIGPHLSVRLQAKNVTDPTIQQVYREPDGTETNRRKGKQGVTYSISVSCAW
jgi:TonB-dependent receptor